MTLARSLFLVTLAAAALSALVAFSYGGPDGLLTFAVLLVPGACAVLIAHFAAARREHIGSLRRQLGFAAVVAIGQLAVVAAAGAALMFVSTHDAVLALVLIAMAAVVAVRTSQLLSQEMLSDVERLRATLVAVGDGARVPAPSPASRDELAELTAAVNATIARLEDTERARRDLIAAVSHDLRTPITSLRLLADAVADQVVTGDTRTAYLTQMGTHVTALSGLIDDLFELSRLEAGDVQWSLERVRLDELVGETVEAMRPQADARMVRVMAELTESAATARANPERLQRVLFNLIQNAIRHTPADGSVTVSAQAADGCVEIEVADTGSGIAIEDRGRVFEPFFRGRDDASRTGEGAGLGLAISRAIVEAHGGRIWLEDAVLGTRVRFSLPQA
jgi:signal transduction histidine kinase